MLVALAVFSLVFLTAMFRHPDGIGCGLQFGGDYLLFHSSGRMILSGHARELYDLKALKEIQLELFKAPLSNCLGADVPVAYLPVFLLPYTILSLLSPFSGFLVSTAVTVGIFALAFWRLARVVDKPAWVLWLFGLGSFAILLGINYGQVHGWLFLAMTEFYIALRRQHDKRAGLWLALLVVKPQFLPLFVLFLLWQRRWRALGSFLVASCSFFVGSVSIVGWWGFQKYVGYLVNDVAPMNASGIGVGLMVNWRGFVLNWLAVNSDTNMAMVTALLSLLTIAGLVPWLLRSWQQTSQERLPLVLLGLASAALLVGYDTGLHSAVLVLPPGLQVASDLTKQGANTRLAGPWVLDLILLVPSLAFMANLLVYRDPWLSWVTANQVMILGMVAALVWIAIGSIKEMSPTLQSATVS